MDERVEEMFFHMGDREADLEIEKHSLCVKGCKNKKD